MSDQPLHILGIMVSERTKAAGKVQETLTRYGCCIKTRLGLHEATNDICSPNGLIILEMVGDVTEIQKLEKELTGMEGVTVRKMVF